MIEIELAKDGKRFKKNIVIQCTIKREGNKSIYSVDGKPQGKRAVVDLARSLSIQIDNLCQFLPQDKVVEFAAMTPVELLRSTQRAVASQEMIEMHEQLKDLGKKQKDAQAKCTADQDSLTNLESRQRGQEADVERMREREQAVKHVSYLEAARPFAAYRTARLVHMAAKNKRIEASEELEKLKNEVEPSLRALSAKQRYKDQIERVEAERRDAIGKAERRADGIDKKFRDLQDKHNECVAQYEAERSRGREKKQEIARHEDTIRRLKRQMEEQPSELDLQTFNERIREKRRAIQNCHDQIKELKSKQSELTSQGRERKFQVQQAENELAKLSSQAGKQEKKLQNWSRDTAKLWDWVQHHQDEFEKPVLGPPIVECSVKEPRYVDLVESLFQKGIMVSFTAQTKNDFKKLSDIGASQRLSEVSIKTMGDGLEFFQPPVSAGEMSRFGFDHWALDLLEGPEKILAMLCAEVHIHATGVGMRDTNNQQFEMLQNSHISAWVTSVSTYKINRRREYGPGATSTQVKPVRKAAAWTEQPVDLTAKKVLQENIAGLNEEVAACSAEIGEAQTRILAWRDSIQTASEEEVRCSALFRMD